MHNENEWEDGKVGRRKKNLVRRMESAKHFIRTNIEPFCSIWPKTIECFFPLLKNSPSPKSEMNIQIIGLYGLDVVTKGSRGLKPLGLTSQDLKNVWVIENVARPKS